MLRSSYGFDRPSVLSGLRSLLRAPNVQLEHSDAVHKTLDWYERGMDFADALHLASAGDDVEFATFDRSLATTAHRLGIGRVVAL
ncbi:MAG TPA: hypothetical protein VMT64_10460 [Candidatus Binataceae bacterium]|nr:hypothetical protein [Candidatus Binataceae bacterium]